MWKTAEGSTGRLIQLCLAYFALYTVFGVLTKYFTGSKAVILPAMSNMDFLIWSTVGGSAMCLAVLFFTGWHLADATRSLKVGPLRVPPEFAYIIPSGIFTAIIIPTTTLLYMLLKSVMVAMVVMRASVIVISRIVDAVQIKQKILNRTVYWEENVAVLFALAAASTQILLGDGSGGSDLLSNALAMGVLISYIIAYGFRIYVMNYYKNTRPKGATLDNRWFFGIEQITATAAMIALATGFFVWASQDGATLAYATAVKAGEMAQAAAILAEQPLVAFHSAVANPHTNYIPAIWAGAVFGGVAFFSVFIFMFKGRTATFATLVNRLTSLVAGTAATLLAFLLLGTRFPSLSDWVSLGLIFVAVGFLTMAEKRRAAELAKAQEIEAIVPAADAPAAVEAK
ncbi:MAG: hypothetical protein FJZ01_16925 [Candidatus Sericytochromatia bacterium]|nr:hypothetical protein [Candidatus Tanganyikabacteria bacterium]